MKPTETPVNLPTTIEKNPKIGIIVISPTLEIEQLNKAAEAVFSINKGKKPTNLSSLLEEDPTFLAWIQAHLGDSDGETSYLYVDAGTNQTHQVWLNSIPSNKNETRGYILHLIDVSNEQKLLSDQESIKESVTAIIDTLNEYYFETDIRGVVTNINLAFCQQLGFTRKEDIIGKHLRHFTDRDSVRQVYQNYRKVFEERETVKLFRYTYHTRDGRPFIGETTVSPIIQGDQVVGARGLLRDVSQRVRAEEALTKTTEDLEAKVREVAVINRISILMSESLILKTMLHTLCEEFTHIFPIRNAGIGIITPDKESLEVLAFHSDNLEEESLEGMLLPLKDNLAFIEVVKEKKPIWIRDAGKDPRMGSVAGLAAERGTRSLMIAPLLSRGEAIGTIWLPALDPEHVFLDKELDLAGTIANQIAAAIDNAQLFAKTETALDSVEHDLQIGKAIQSGFFPETIPQIPGWEISTHYESARYVSGDFYDIFPLGDSNKMVFVIADVCDKGIGAALFMVLFRSLLRAFSRNVDTTKNASQILREIIQNTNSYVAGIHGNASMFATVFLGIIDPTEGVISYVNGGHEPPVLIDKEGITRSRLGPTGPAIGLFENAKYETGEIHLIPGDFLVGYTDGTLDAENTKGEAFTEERFLDLIQAPWTSLFSMVYELRSEIKKHAGTQKQFDDITLLSIRRKENPLLEKHGICRVVDIRSPIELMDFVEAAAIESKLSKAEAISLRLATDMICKNLLQSGVSGEKPGLLSLFFERDAERVSIIIRDDGAPLGEEILGSMTAALIAMNPIHESREPWVEFSHLAHEVMEPAGNKFALDMTRRISEYESLRIRVDT